MNTNPTIIMPGVTIDADPIAKGLLRIMDTMPDGDSYKATLRFGMLPGPLMEIVGKILQQKADELAKPSRSRVAEYRILFEGLDMDEYWADADKKIATWIRDFMLAATKQITQAMYANGELVV